MPNMGIKDTFNYTARAVYRNLIRPPAVYVAGEMEKVGKTANEKIIGITESHEEKYNRIKNKRIDLETKLENKIDFDFANKEDEDVYRKAITNIVKNTNLPKDVHISQGFLMDRGYRAQERITNSFLRAALELKEFAEEVYNPKSDKIGDPVRNIAKEHIDTIANEINSLPRPLEPDKIKAIRQKTEDLRVACGLEPREKKSLFRAENLKKAGLILAGVAISAVFPPAGIAIIGSVVLSSLYSGLKALMGYDDKYKAQQRVDPKFQEKLLVARQTSTKPRDPWGILASSQTNALLPAPPLDRNEGSARIVNAYDNESGASAVAETQNISDNNSAHRLGS